MRKNNLPDSESIKEISQEILSNMFPRLVVFSDVINRFVGIVFKDKINWLKIESLIQLAVIGKGAMAHSEMARNLLRSKQQITKLVDGLEKEGLIQRELDKDNRRITHVRITMEGIAYIKQSLADIEPIEKVVRSTMSEDESEMLANVFRFLRRALIKEINDAVGEP